MLKKIGKHRQVRDRENAGLPGKSETLGEGKEGLAGQRIPDEKFWISGRRIKKASMGNLNLSTEDEVILWKTGTGKGFERLAV